MRNPAVFIIVAEEIAKKYNLLRDAGDSIPLTRLVNRMDREDLKFMAILAKRNLGEDSLEFKMINGKLER